MTSDILTFERSIDAPLSQVYRAFTNSSALREWFCDAAQADPHPDGRLYVWWNSGYFACGQYTAAEENQRVAFTWQGKGEPAATQVGVALAERDGGAHVTVTHSGVGSGESWEAAIKEFERGWQIGLENLQSVLETGQDLRYLRRPMLGVMVGEFNPEIAAELGIPVTDGIRLEGAIEGMGAAAAGLQKDDVVVGIAGVPVTGWPSLTNALQGQRAGDRVDVEFYRGQAKSTVVMELSRRPLPDVPETPEALSEAVREIYAGLDAELDQFFEGISEAEASFRASPDEWSAKESLAHLIEGERGWHRWITDLIGGHEAWYDDWGGNVSTRYNALMAAYPTVPALLEELKRCEAETIAYLAALPPEFVARKGSYTRLVYAMLETPGYHTHAHLDQMRQAVEAARAQEA